MDARKPELLAPAGNVEALHAAVSAGADAVYMGLDEFNARRNAGNFSLEDFGDACDYAHLRGVRVYVTMNVEILTGEIDRALELARSAWLAGADAFIVQDIGLAAEMRRCLPHAALHISTQMNTHNAAGIEAAALLGARRVTLARELSLAEVAELAELARAFDMEVECFAHGALCVCYSGQCLMSSMIGGRSANRGLCAQACRLPYELHRADRDGALAAPGEHLLSPRDLCTIDMLDDLATAGVASLKIEGRMKSADYVHEVVSVYRDVLDRGLPATERHHSRLDEAFSRGFTTAYLTSRRGNDIMSYGRPNNRGVFAGRVTRAEDGLAHVRAEIDVNAGDVVEFWTNKGHFAATVPAGAQAGGTLDIPVEQRTGKGDRVFRVRNAATAFTDDALAPRIPVSGSVSLLIGAPAQIRFTTDDGIQAEAMGDPVETARTKAVTEEDVRSHVNRLGQTPYSLDDERLDVSLSDGAGIGFSALHHLRTEALDALSAELLSPYRDRRAPECSARRRSAKAAFARSFEVVAWASNPSCARAAKRAGAAEVYVPLLNFRRGQATLKGTRSAQAEQAGYPKQCIMALPTVEHDPVDGTREQQLTFEMWDYVREGRPVFADSLGDVVRALNCGAQVEVGPHVPVTNHASLAYLAELGVARVWLSPELTLGQIADLAQDAPVALGLVISGAQELMITEHCLLMSQGPCAETCETCERRGVEHYLLDRKGFSFPVVTDLLGRSHLYNGIELDALSTLPDLVDIGISRFMVDTTLMDKKEAEAAVRRAVKGLNLATTSRESLQKRPGTTTGHLFRGVF